MRVSVIIPTYNRANFVGAAIRSVLDQIMPDLEVLVIDDGSTDDTATVVAQIDDPRVRYVYHENHGLTFSRNRGIELSQGDWIAFLDSDDLFLPHKLALQLAVAERDPEIGFVAGGYQYIDKQGEIIGEARPWLWSPRLELVDWMMGCPVMPSAALVQQQWLKEINGFDLAIAHGASDWDCWLRLSLAGCKMVWANELVCKYRIHKGGMAQDAVRQARGAIDVLNRVYARPDLPNEIRALKDRAYAIAHLKGACREYATGETEIAAQDLHQAITLDSDLMADNGAMIARAIVDWAAHPITSEPLRYVRTVFAHLPDSAAGLCAMQRQALSQAALGILFEAYRVGDRPRARRAWLRAVRYDPSCLRNRGVLSVGARLLLGERFVETLQVIPRSMSHRSLRLEK